MRASLIAAATAEGNYYAQHHKYIGGYQALQSLNAAANLVEFVEGGAHGFGLGTGAGVDGTPGTTSGTSWELDLTNGKIVATCKDWGHGAHACPTGKWHPNLPAALAHQATTGTKSAPASAAPSSPTTSSASTSAAPPSSLTTSQRNAVASAKNYLSTAAFSRQGLIDQLSSSAGEGYPVSDATVAVDSLHVNWDAEAIQSAKQYLHTSPFSALHG
jgi:hypothetical protein